MKRRLLPHHLSRQLVSFSLVGLSSNLLGYSVYLILVANWLDPKPAITILYFIGVIIGYFGNKRLTFRHQRGFLLSSARYLAVYTFGYLLNLILIFWFVDRLGFPHQIVQVIAIFIVAIVLFMMLRAFVFRCPSFDKQA
jgi:putative flippase GtrA